MQRIACVAVCCSVLQCVLPYKHTAASWGSRTQIKNSFISILLCVAACHSVLQCVALCCSVLQCVAVCCSVLQCIADFLHCLLPYKHTTASWSSKKHTQNIHTYLYYSVLQCVAGCRRVLQRVAGCCRVLQCVAVCCSACYLIRTPRRAGAASRTQSSIWISPIYTCNMTHSYLCHDSFIFLCVTWIIQICDMIHSYMTNSIGTQSSIRISPIYLCDTTHSYVLHDSFIFMYVTRCIHVCGIIHA